MCSSTAVKYNAYLPNKNIRYKYYISSNRILFKIRCFSPLDIANGTRAYSNTIFA